MGFMMRRPTDQLDQAILQAVSCHFQPLESIVETLNRSDHVTPLPFDESQIRGSLLALITDQLVNAYQLHAERPYITPVPVNPDTVVRAWYLITERGRKSLVRSARIHGMEYVDFDDVECA